MNPYPPRGAFFPNMTPIPINLPNLANMMPGQFPPMPPMGIPLPALGLPNPTQVASMGITLPTGVTSISAPPVRKITPNLGVNQNKPMQSFQMSHAPVNKQSNFTNQKSKYTGPIITVFVGNINEKVSDIVIRQILDKCGNVTNWKRIKGPNGKFQAFGFCDYAEADSALRAIRLLNEFEIGDKKLLVRVDAKQKEKLDTYANDSNNESSTNDEESNSKDEKALEQIKTILKENETELKTRSTEENDGDSANGSMSSLQQQIQPNQKQQIPAEPNLQNFSDMDIEDEKKTLIHREIGKFRSTYKKQDEEKEKLDAERARDREVRKERERRDRDRERNRLTPSRDRKLEVNSNPSRYDRERFDRMERPDRTERNDRMDRMERPDRTERNDRMDRIDRIDRMERTDRETSNRSAYEDEEAIEQRRQLREERKKEQSYQKRLRDWESREDRKKRQFEKDEYRQIEKKKEEERELLRLKQFLEDYNDDLDDAKYYKGSNFMRKLRDYEKEREDDERDRYAEKKELDDLRRKLAEEGHPDPESEAKKLMSNVKAAISIESNKSIAESNDNGHWVNQQPNEEIHVKAFSLTKQDNRPLKSNLNSHSSASDQIDISITPVSEFLNQTNQSTAHNASTNDKKKQLSVHDVFNSNEDDDKTQLTKKRKLPVFIDDTDSNQSVTSNPNKNSSSSDSKSLSSDDKRKQIKALIDNIPTTKEELFKYEIEWDYVDASLMEKRIRPWINKKITEYIGEEEKALLDFICGKLNARCNAQSILDDVAMVLDDEAEVFIVKMLRLLIYEIEAKKIGLGK